ncbi:MAG: IS701 family transposase, partial [Pseudonocardiaceae bacterium]
MIRIGARFKRVEPRRLAGDLLRGMVSDLAVKNCWTIAEHAGHASPDRLQHLLRAAAWDEDGIVADLREYVVEHLGEKDGLLIVDETGDLKKGTHTVGVQRQYTGTAGRIENAQVAVYLTYATAMGHTLMDRALYLPKSWTENPRRCADAGVPEGTKFATKPALAGELITRALDAGVAARWVAGDEVYGTDGKFSRALEARGVGYVLAVACDHRVGTTARKRVSSGKTRVVLDKKRADELVAGLPKRAWQQLSAGAGSKGERVYDWAWVTIASEPAKPAKTQPIDTSPGCWWLLVRRNRTTGELAFYRCYSPRRVPLAALVRVAGRRWRIEESFQSSKN